MSDSHDLIASGRSWVPTKGVQLISPVVPSWINWNWFSVCRVGPPMLRQALIPFLVRVNVSLRPLNSADACLMCLICWWMRGLSYNEMRECIGWVSVPNVLYLCIHLSESQPLCNWPLVIWWVSHHFVTTVLWAHGYETAMSHIQIYFDVLLIQAYTLVPFNKKLPVSLACVVSGYGVGGVISYTSWWQWKIYLHMPHCTHVQGRTELCTNWEWGSWINLWS